MKPTTDLHLLASMNRLVEGRGTVVGIEQNLDVSRNADWLIYEGPEGAAGVAGDVRGNAQAAPHCQAISKQDVVQPTLLTPNTNTVT